MTYNEALNSIFVNSKNPATVERDRIVKILLACAETFDEETDGKDVPNYLQTLAFRIDNGEFE